MGADVSQRPVKRDETSEVSSLDFDTFCMHVWLLHGHCQCNHDHARRCKMTDEPDPRLDYKLDLLGIIRRIGEMSPRRPNGLSSHEICALVRRISERR